MGLQENIRDEPVSKLEVRDPLNVPPTASVRETVGLMRKHDIGCAVVVDDQKKPVGMITESMLAEMVAHGTLRLDDPVSTHMADRVPWVRLSDPIADVVEAMQLKNIRILCVVDDRGRSVGLTGQRGLMEYVADHFPGEVMVQRVGQTPYLADREGA
jgi:CBS domain-containing protein